MATFTLGILDVNDFEFIFTAPAVRPKFREDETHVYNVGQHIHQSTPHTREFMVVEDMTDADIISNVGIGTSENGPFGSSVTLPIGSTIASDDTLDELLFIQFTLGNVDADTNIDIDFTTTEPWNVATFTLGITSLNTPEWDSIADFTVMVGETIDIDLYQYLDDSFDGTITRKVSVNQFPPNLSIVEGRYLQGDVTKATEHRTLQLTATREGVSVDSPTFGITVESDMVSVPYHEWDTPTITNIEISEDIDMFVGNALESGDGVFFFAKFRARRTDNQDWTLMNPRFSLPVATASPSRITGGGEGYGGSEKKFQETLMALLDALGAITGSTLISYDAAAVHDGVIYIGGRDKVFSFDAGTRVLTEILDMSDDDNVKALVSHSGNLYATTKRPIGFERLYRINNPSGSATTTLIGTIQHLNSYIEVYALADFNSTVYMLAKLTPAGSTVRLYTLDVSNADETFIGFTGSSAEHTTLVVFNEKLYTVVGGIFYEVDTSSGSLSDKGEIGGSIDTAFYHNDTLYGIDGTTLYEFDLYNPPLFSADFKGDTYTTAIAKVVENESLLEVQIEKLQQNDSPVFLNIAGSYKK